MATTSTRNVLNSNSWLVAQKQLALARKRFADRVRAVFDALPTVLAKRVTRMGFKGLSQLQSLFDDALRNAIELMQAHMGDLLADTRGAFRMAVGAGDAEEALLILAAVLKKQQFSEGVDFTEQWEVHDALARFRRGHWDGTINPQDAARLVADLAFPPPSKKEVKDALRQPLPGGLDWDTRLRSWAQPLRAQIFSQLVDGLANGENVTDLEQRLRPITGALPYKAWRIANTEAGKVMMRDYMRRIEGVGDLLAGQQIVAVMDERTRASHAARHGTIYWRQPNGEYRSERGQLMPDLPDAPNCRCIFIPVMQPPPRVDLVRTADNKVIADHLSFADWWEQASDVQRKKAVGTHRYQTMQQIVGSGGSPSWFDFLSEDGTRLLTVQELRAEHPALRQLRTTELKRQAIERTLQYRDVYSRLTVADAEEVPDIVFRHFRWNLSSDKAKMAIEWAFMRVMGFAGPEGRQEAMRRAAWSSVIHTAHEAVQEATARLNRVMQLQQLAENFSNRAKQNLTGLFPHVRGKVIDKFLEQAKTYVKTAYVIESFFLPPNMRADLSGFPVSAPLKNKRGLDGRPYDWTIEKAMNLLSRLCSPRVGAALRQVGRNGLHFEGPVNRSGYFFAGKVRMDVLNGPEIVAHEVGHALEEAIPQLGQEALQYYRNATQGSNRVNIPPNGTIRPRTDGRLWPDLPYDEWIHVPRQFRYMGRDYAGAGTEISSLVLQAIFQGRFEDLRELLQNAPDIAEMVLRHLR